MDQVAVTYLIIINTVGSFNTNQIEVVFVEVLLSLTVLAFLSAPALFARLGVLLVLVLVGDEASTFLCFSQHPPDSAYTG